MSSLDIFVENINRIANYYCLNTYSEIAKFLDVTEYSVKHWQNKTRSPSLKKIDELSDRIGCPSYALLQRDGKIFAEVEFINKRYFLRRGAFHGMIKQHCFMDLLVKMF